MTQLVEIPVWLLVLIVGFAAIAALDKVMLPSVRWFFRRRLEKAVAQLNERLERPIQPFKLARRYDMIQRLIYDPEVSQAIADHARAEGVPENVAFEKARKYAREIVPSFSASAYFGFAIRAARFLSNALYRVRLGHHDEEALKQIDPKATVVFVMNHRSNMDYVLVTYLAAERSALSYAVGEWARVWPLSRLIRAMGAYFIRRRARNELYSRILARYVQLAMRGGVTQAFFPEGGLSVQGKLMPLKLGLLNYIVDGFEQTERDVVFVPVALNYDRVLEDRVLLQAAQSGRRRFRARISVIAGFALKQLWLRITGRFYRFGYAAVSFGAPVSLNAFIDQYPSETTRRLGTFLFNRIGELVPVLPVPLTASVLLEQGAMTRAEVEAAMKEAMAHMPQAHIHLPRQDHAYMAEVGLRHLLKRHIIRQDGDIYRIDEKERPVCQFYANSIAHLAGRKIAENAATAKQHSAAAGS
ncbi:1-acyl-sn-glycerol-3-phosphate acyltransferase [Thalassococcus sp. S3]|uniref:1-acyl-sn-glycerol-3-phosphate acyltransferase n=1 Tax=Thalassococcus sp. S3 TaxID=2017482 RepID=UPI0010247467|nr:1-acyl-sn-glycerol-3-phosphate acyltransferase [Thalassococcus sp. S3]QBF33622.1 glycerol-3-phosphate acyltransferase [Thalassococcus sp. S3]